MDGWIEKEKKNNRNKESKKERPIKTPTGEIHHV